MDASFVECIKELVEMPWKYVILLQNHDIQIRTNLEIVQVLQWLNGTNDIEVAKPPASRIPTGVGSELDFESLRLFRNESKYIKQLYNGLPPKLQLAKSYVESSLSRAMAEFIVRDLNLEPLLELMRGKNKEFGREMLFPSLHSTLMLWKLLGDSPTNVWMKARESSILLDFLYGIIHPTVAVITCVIQFVYLA
uniref:Uncharacterized protein n=1 Tax=Ditylenchus dipsaci TaxID=166011 RepID=A0A915CVI7_9BILA